MTPPNIAVYRLFLLNVVQCLMWLLFVIFSVLCAQEDDLSSQDGSVSSSGSHISLLSDDDLSDDDWGDDGPDPDLDRDWADAKAANKTTSANDAVAPSLSFTLLKHDAVEEQVKRFSQFYSHPLTKDRCYLLAADLLACAKRRTDDANSKPMAAYVCGCLLEPLAMLAPVVGNQTPYGAHVVLQTLKGYGDWKEKYQCKHTFQDTLYDAVEQTCVLRFAQNFYDRLPTKQQLKNLASDLRQYRDRNPGDLVASRLLQSYFCICHEDAFTQLNDLFGVKTQKEAMGILRVVLGYGDFKNKACRLHDALLSGHEPEKGDNLGRMFVEERLDELGCAKSDAAINRVLQGVELEIKMIKMQHNAVSGSVRRIGLLHEAHTINTCGWRALSLALDHNRGEGVHPQLSARAAAQQDQLLNPLFSMQEGEHVARCMQKRVDCYLVQQPRRCVTLTGVIQGSLSFAEEQRMTDDLLACAERHRNLEGGRPVTDYLCECLREPFAVLGTLLGPQPPLGALAVLQVFKKYGQSLNHTQCKGSLEEDLYTQMEQTCIEGFARCFYAQMPDSEALQSLARDLRKYRCDVAVNPGMVRSLQSYYCMCHEEAFVWLSDLLGAQTQVQAEGVFKTIVGYGSFKADCGLHGLFMFEGYPDSAEDLGCMLFQESAAAVSQGGSLGLCQDNWRSVVLKQRHTRSKFIDYRPVGLLHEIVPSMTCGWRAFSLALHIERGGGQSAYYSLDEARVIIEHAELKASEMLVKLLEWQERPASQTGSCKR